MSIRWASASDVGRMRDHNEDAVLPAPGESGEGDRLLAAVADGMGGHVGGEVASQTAIETLAVVSGSPAMRVQAANVAVRDAAEQQPRLRGMGTTLTVVEIEDGTMSVGHVGDSRLYRLRDGELAQLTQDQTYVAEMIAAGRMTPEEAEVHPYRSVLLRAVGLEANVEVETAETDVATGDVILICSDGLSAMVPDDQIASLLAGNEEPGQAATALIGAANAAGGADNISVVVVAAE